MEITEFVQAIVNLIAVPTAVISVLLLIKQTRQLDDTMRSQVYQGLIDNSLKIDQLLIEHPELRKYIYGKEPVDEKTPDLDKLMSVTEFMIDIVDNLKAQEKYIPKPLIPGWRNFAQDVLNSPATRYFLEKHGTWYSSGLSEISIGSSQQDLVYEPRD